MKWFPGPYTLAAQVSKKNGALLVVFVETVDETGTKMRQHWEQLDQSIFNGPSVCVNLKSGEAATTQFIQQYPSPIFPASYFIDNGGKLIEILFLDDADFDTFSVKVAKIVEKFANSKKLAETSSHDTKTDSAAETAQQPTTGVSLSLDEKVKRAKELLEKKRQADEEQKKTEEKEKELDRIRSGKLMQETAQRREEQEVREAAAQRRREKEEAQREMERVKAQIKADREEREYRQKRTAGVVTEEKPVAATEKTTQERVLSDSCRIQIRLPGAGSTVQEHSSNEKLSRVADALREENLVHGSFSLVQPYPRHVFSAEEMNKSFLDLCLTPSCTLAVEQTRSTASSLVSSNPIYSLFSFIIFTPLQYIWNFVLSFIGRGNTSSNTKKDEPASSGDAVRPRGIPPSASIRRRGNVSGLHNPNGDDPEENANWNGNSTQFM